MLAIRSHASALAMVASKSLARRRVRPSQAKVRSTTQRRGSSWKPLSRAGARRFRSSKGPIGDRPSNWRRDRRGRRRHGADRGTHGRTAQREPRRVGPGCWRAPARRAGKPCVSVTMWRLRPLMRLAASTPRGPPLSVVGTLWLSMMPADGVARRPSASEQRHQTSVDLRAMSHRRASGRNSLARSKRRKLPRQEAPLTARRQQIENSVDDRAQIALARPPRRRGGGSSGAICAHSAARVSLA